MIDRRRWMGRAGAACLPLAWPARVPAAAPPPHQVVVLGRERPEAVHGDAALADARHVACSTFKIPLTLIALEEGLVRDPDAVVELDARTYEPQPWWSAGMRADWGRPHSLRSAFAVSAVWFYRRLALQLGRPRLVAYLSAFGYGDVELSAGLDNFWNAGDRGLRISPVEQWRFLHRVAHRALALSSRTHERAQDLFVRERSPQAVLRAKTGLGWRGEARASQLVGWFVGWSETAGGDLVPFASLGLGGSEVIAARVDNAMAALRRRNAWG